MGSFCCCFHVNDHGDTVSDHTITSQPRTFRFDDTQLLYKDLKQLRDGDHARPELRDNDGSKMRSPLKNLESEVADSYPESSEDEDVCPTCLEEYTPENPKIVTQCCHHYHLSCIYEWMERSKTCPVCSKVMAFNETI